MKVSFFCIVLIATQVIIIPTKAASLWDQIPLISQVKSVVQVISGDRKGAEKTQENFTKGIFLPAPIVRSLIELVSGDTKAAGETWESTGKNAEGLVDGLPVIGHVKGGIHYAIGETERGNQIMKSSTRSLGVIGGGAVGFIVSGMNPAGAVAGGIAGGVAIDGIITGTDSAIHGEYRPNGQIKGVSEIFQGKSTSGSVFDTVMNVGGDALAGWGGGNIVSSIQGGSAAGTSGASIVENTYAASAPPGSIHAVPMATPHTSLASSVVPTPHVSVIFDGLNSASSVASAPAVLQTVTAAQITPVVAVNTDPSTSQTIGKEIVKGFVPNKDPRTWVPNYGEME